MLLCTAAIVRNPLWNRAEGRSSSSHMVLFNGLLVFSLDRELLCCTEQRRCDTALMERPEEEFTDWRLSVFTMFILEWSVIVSPGAPVVVINMEIRCRQGEGGLHILLPDMRRNIRVKPPIEEFSSGIGRDLVNSVLVS